jgi:hypothetical protein
MTPRDFTMTVTFQYATNPAPTMYLLPRIILSSGNDYQFGIRPDGIFAMFSTVNSVRYDFLSGSMSFSSTQPVTASISLIGNTIRIRIEQVGLLPIEAQVTPAIGIVDTPGLFGIGVTGDPGAIEIIDLIVQVHNVVRWKPLYTKDIDLTSPLHLPRLQWWSKIQHS